MGLEEALDEVIMLYEELLDVLVDVTDEASARAAADDVMRITDEFEELENRMGDYSNEEIARAAVSTRFFGFANDLGELNRLGPDPVFNAADTTRYVALLMTHEIGHLVLHLGHPWSNSACAMYPLPPGAMGAYLRAVDPAVCPVGSEPAMKPGACPIRYDRLVLEELGN